MAFHSKTIRLLSFSFLLFPIACGDADSFYGDDDDWGGGGSFTDGDADADGDWGDEGGGDLGADTGGVQDIGYARQVIDGGGVPQEQDIPIEGLLSEHDLPTEGEPCEDLFCLRPNVGVGPSLATDEQAVWVKMGMSSGLAQPFVRPPLDLVVLIDKSDSMSIDIVQVDAAVATLVGKMTDRDRLAILAFDDDITEVHAFGAVENAAALQDAVRGIAAGGGWGIDAAVERAYGILAEAGDDPTRMSRVALFTCGYPGVNLEGRDPFSQQVLRGAERHIAMSVFGVLLGWDANVADLMGRARGGAFHYMEDLSAVERVFDEEFDYLMTPLAYDLRISLDLADGVQLDHVYGVPADPTGEPRYEVDVATVFVSTRHGAATFLRIRPPEGEGPLGSMSFTYDPETAHGLPAPVAATTELTVPGTDGGDQWQGTGVRKGVFLINQAERMGDACAAFHSGDAPESRRILDELLVYLRAEQAALEADDLDAEIALVERLRANVGE